MTQLESAVITTIVVFVIALTLWMAVWYLYYTGRVELPWIERS